MQGTPKGLRLHIGIFGRRNVGKSSLLNAVTRQDVSIVSPDAGTTTDPVEKPMELLPLGPVLFIDTAGVDDAGALGEQRVERTRRVLDRVDVAVLVAESGAWGEFEEGLLDELQTRGVAVLVAMNKADLAGGDDALEARLKADGVPAVRTAMPTGEGLAELRQAIMELAPSDFFETRALISDLVGPAGVAVLVIPVDKEAPRGRLILPQAQAIRDLLDHDALCVVAKERELAQALAALKDPPALVVTDSQAFREVAAVVPETVPMTGFSVLFSRFLGDLEEQVRGTLAIDGLKNGDAVLVAEACTHHPIGDDIGRVKIPHWLREHTGADLSFRTVQGHDFPEDLSPYALVVHCGACMGNRREMLSRIHRCARQGIPITNYGLAIAYSLGILDRALGPFPAAREVYRAGRASRPRTR